MSNDCEEELKQLQEKYSALLAEHEHLLKKHHNSASKYEEIFDQLPYLTVQGYNSRREVIYWNKFSSRLYGYTPQEALGKQIEELIIPDCSRKRVIENIENWVHHGITIPSGELVLMHKDGSAVPVFSQHVMLELPDQSRELFCLDIDLRELKEKDKLLQEAKKLAFTDGLTYLYNRLFYSQIADLEIKLARRNGQYLVFAMFDMDYFKKYNDNYGHTLGDELLKTFAVILQQHCCRPNDYPFRIGGEEFLLIYTADSVERTHDLASQVFNDFFQLAIPHKNNPPQEIATVSVGIAVLSPDKMADSDQLYHCADEALYKAKKNGRNNYVISFY